MRIYEILKKLQGKHFSHPWNEYALYGRSLSITFLDLIMVIIKIILYVVTDVWRSCFYWFVIYRNSIIYFLFFWTVSCVGWLCSEVFKISVVLKSFSPKAALKSLNRALKALMHYRLNQMIFMAHKDELNSISLSEIIVLMYLICASPVNQLSLNIGNTAWNVILVSHCCANNVHIMLVGPSFSFLSFSSSVAVCIFFLCN